MAITNILIFTTPKRMLALTASFKKNSLIFSFLPMHFLRKFMLPFSLLVFIFGLLFTDKNFDARIVIDQLTSPSVFIEDNYVDPRSVDVIFPENKRNLIFIYLESVETSLLSVELGGAMTDNIIPEITQLMKNNITFSHTDGLGGGYILNSGWTIASLVSQTAGLPLYLGGRGNELLPNITTLGTILEENGYSNTFMIGSNASFGDRDIFFRTHGNYRLLDYVYARDNGIIPQDYRMWWGFEDEKLYSWAKDEILRLSHEDVPFNFTLLTADTHHPSGYHCILCVEVHSMQLMNVFSCASQQVFNFILWAKEQDFYDDTLIVISSDHLSMDADLSSVIEENYKRMLPVIFINTAVEPVNTTNREFSVLDMFPTTLAALGVEIQGNRLALGTNLFSDEQTLLELFTVEVVSTELGKLSVFYNESFW